MNWKTKDTFDLRLEFITRFELHEHADFGALCDEFGISRQTGYATLERYKAEGRDGLRARSRAPVHSPNAISQEIEDALLELRSRYPTWGPRKLIAHLTRKQPRRGWPSASTVGELLRRHGLSHPR